MLDGVASSSAPSARNVQSEVEGCALAMFAALAADDSHELKSLVGGLRILVQASSAEEDLLMIDAALAVAGRPRTKAMARWHADAWKP